MGSGSSTLSNVSPEYVKPSADAISSGSTASYSVKPAIGQKRALLIGNNYTGTKNELKGCINDVNRVKSLIGDLWGFTCTIMTDKSGGDLYTSKDNILNKMDSFLSSLSTNDTFILYFSGHGALVNDENGDEIYGKDSVIVPSDYSANGYIIDDEIRQKLLKAVNGKVFCFFDSCNSGSVCDLRYNLLSNVYRTILSTNKIFDPKEWSKTIEIVTNTNYTETNTNILSLSGSRDNQFSYEIIDSSGSYGGALTFAVINVLRSQTPNISILDFLGYVRSQILSWGLTSQTPSLMSGKEFTDESLKVNDYLGI